MDLLNAFLFYLISHNRPIAEVLNPSLLNIRSVYEQDFVGMTKENVTIESLLNTRDYLISSYNLF